jgi:hypothetical protein
MESTTLAKENLALPSRAKRKLAPPRDVSVKRQAEHDRASEAWADTRWKSPTAGLAELARGSGPRHRSEEHRRSEQAALKKRQDRALADNVRPYVRPVDHSRYFPHQSDQECARRVRQGKAI